MKSKRTVLFLILIMAIGLISLSIVHGAGSYSWGVTKQSSTEAQFWFQPSGWTASYVILHYTIAGQVQQNVYTSYNSSESRWVYNVANLTSGKTISYNFTFNQDGRQYDSSMYSYSVGAASTGSSAGSSVSPSPSASAISGSNYMYNNLVWSDEFTGSSLNRSNWNYQIGNGYNSGSSAFDGWGNGEWEWYREANVSVASGNLVIKGEYVGTPYVFANRNWYQFSGRITTKGLKSWKYARIEARIKLPTVASTWPAFWMMGNNCDTTVNGAAGGYDKLPTNWASCGEIDIMEHKNGENQICSNLFWDTRTGLYPWASNTNANNPTWTSGVDVSQYHVYAMEWNATTLKYYLDGKVIKTQDISAAAQEEFHNQNWFVILNLAISGTFTGPVIPNRSDFPCYMYVDYVRVYQ
jgi:beta-glucanase (GH16 family)